MCGRYAVGANAKQISRTFKAEPDPAAGEHLWDHPVYSVAPSTAVPVVRNNEADQQRLLLLAKWGFQPSWAKPGGPKPINARVESAASSGMWRAALSSGRILIPMSGYFEWVETETGKQPIYLHDPSQPLLAAAGLLTMSKNSDGTAVATFAVLTQQAHDAAGEIHERMPVFLPQTFWTDWLTVDHLEQDQRAHLLNEATDTSTETTSHLTSHPVDRQVNNARTADRYSPSLIEAQ